MADYIHWTDFLTAPSRTWEELPWVGKRVFMTREEFPDMNNIHEPAGDDHEKTDPVLPAPACPPCHLVEFRSPQGAEFMTVEEV